ncbi:hypothetical protein V6N13_089989 [Hibiscus sabdariffa]
MFFLVSELVENGWGLGASIPVDLPSWTNNYQKFITCPTVQEPKAVMCSFIAVTHMTSPCEEHLKGVLHA